MSHLEDARGLDNRGLDSDENDLDLDRIEVITDSLSSCSYSSHSVGGGSVQELGSQELLTKSADTNFRFTRAHSGEHYDDDAAATGDEFIELASSTDLLRRQRQRSTSTPNNVVTSCGGGVAGNNNRVPTPTNVVRRWSQSISSRFSKEKRNIREKTIYRLPSRKVFEVDGKLLSATSVDPESEIEQLVKEIEQHDNLMQDTALGKQNRMETLRALPQPLATKRLLKQKLSIQIELHSSEERRKWHTRAWNICLPLLLKLWTLLGVICNGVEIWYAALKTIEGHFGSNVSSYFKFLRWLFVINVVLFVCTLGFITLPQMLYGERTVLNVNATKNAETMALRGAALPEDDLPWSTEETNTTSSSNAAARSAERVGWKFLDFLTGEGILKSSLLFYGSYTNVTFSFRDSERTYSLPHAYYMTMLILYLSTFVVISTSMARSYRKSFIETSGGIRSMYAHKIFCSWDYGISDRKAAELKHTAIFTELKEVLSELGESKQKLPILWRIWIFCSQLAAHLLVLAMIAGLGIAIWILLKQFAELNESSPWTTLYVATVVNFSMLLLQSVFWWIARMEDYRSPRRALHVNLVRNFMLEAVIIGILVYFWLTKKYGECWETSIGQEIYRLIISDFFISLLVVPLICAVRIYVVARFWPNCGRPEFDISQQSLGLVFNQTLLWVGLLFAPLLAAVMVVKMVIMFYAKKAMLLHLCKSPRHVWRSAQTHTLYLVFTFLSLLGVIIALGYIMTQVPVSPQCGPFRDYTFMFQIFIDGVLKLRQNQTIWRILMTLIRPAVVGGMLILMAIMVYYLRAKSRARCLMVKLLKEMLYLESKDKEFLLSSIANITKDREWLFDDEAEQDAAASAAADRYAESSATWRYARLNSRSNCCGASSASVESGLAGGGGGGDASGDECVLRSRNV